MLRVTSALPGIQRGMRDEFFIWLGRFCGVWLTRW